jgi:prepilin-type N-terminal cleavage/methylation domain-containing protein
VKNTTGGFTLVEMLAALAIAAMMIVGLTELIDGSLEDSRGQQASLYQSQVTEAAAKYVGANYDALLGSAQADAPAVVDLDALKSYLPTGFNAANAYGQTPCVLVLQPAPGKLDALVVTEGGRPVPAKNLAYLAANAGQGGGYIPFDAPDTAKGAFNSWSVPLATYASGNCSGKAADAGHLASARFFDGPGNLSTDFLYRGRVPNHDELNAMTTPLNMRAQAVENTSDSLCSTTDPNSYGRIAVDANGAVLSCQAGIWKRQGSGYWKDPVDTFALLQALPATDNNTGDVRMVKELARAFTWDGADWKAVAVDQNGDLSIPRYLQFDTVVVEGGICDATGQTARDAAGILMSCQGGTWRSAHETELAFNETGSHLVFLKSKNLSYSPAELYTGPITKDTDTGYWDATVDRVVTMTKAGTINANFTTTMYRRMPGGDPSQLQGSLCLELQLIDNDSGKQVGGNWGPCTPYFYNDFALQSVSASQWVPKNTNGYTVRMISSWNLGPQHPGYFYDESIDTDNRNDTPIETVWNINAAS